MKKFDVEVVTKVTLRVEATNSRVAVAKASRWVAGLEQNSSFVWKSDEQTFIAKCTQVQP